MAYSVDCASSLEQPIALQDVLIGDAVRINKVRGLHNNKLYVLIDKILAANNQVVYEFMDYNLVNKNVEDHRFDMTLDLNRYMDPFYCFADGTALPSFTYRPVDGHLITKVYYSGSSESGIVDLTMCNAGDIVLLKCSGPKRKTKEYHGTYLYKQELPDGNIVHAIRPSYRDTDGVDKEVDLYYSNGYIHTPLVSKHGLPDKYSMYNNIKQLYLIKDKTV
jgi:hypothetical protein